MGVEGENGEVAGWAVCAGVGMATKDARACERELCCYQYQGWCGLATRWGQAQAAEDIDGWVGDNNNPAQGLRELLAGGAAEVAVGREVEEI